MTTQVKNVENLIVGKSASGTMIATSTMNSLADGEVRVFTPSGKVVGPNAAVANMKFVIAVGGANGKPKYVSDVIDGSKISKVTSKAYTPATEQVDNIGYDGTTANSRIDAVPNTLYFGSIYMEDYLRSSHDGRYNKQLFYNSDSTATQAEIASGLTKSGFENFSKEVKNTSGDSAIKFYTLCSDGGTAVGVGGTVVGSKGSKTVTITNGTSSVAFAIGDYLRVGLNTTDAVYKVVASTKLINATGNITLDMPLQDAVNLGGAAAEIITAANTATADFGVKIIGQPLGFVIGKEFYKKTRWTLSLKNFGTTTLTHSVLPKEGTGTYEQVAQHEWFTEGFKGEIYKTPEPIIHTFVPVTTVGSTYDVTRIQFVDDLVVGFHAEVSPKMLTIASPAAAPNYITEATNGVWDVLELIATNRCTGFTAAGAVQVQNLNV